MIQVKHFSQLTETDRRSIAALAADCIQYEQLELDIPDLEAEDGTAYLYYLSPKNTAPVSVLFCYDCEDYLEVSAFTSPKHRCQGFFTSLFQELISQYDELPVCFYPDGNSYDALMTLEVLECEYSGTEHLMRLDAPPAGSAEQTTVTLNRADTALLPVLAAIHSASFDMDEAASYAFLEQSIESGDTVWAICADDSAKKVIGLVLTSIQPSETSLYGLAIHPDFRQNGYGLAAAEALCRIRELNYPIVLHVTEENQAAYRIYRHLGFVTTQELMEYWY